MILLLFCGLPGTGKSRISRMFSEATGAERISSDSIRMNLLEKRTYSREEKEMVYKKMAESAGGLLSSGKNVTADATFYLEEDRSMMRKVAEETGSDFFIVRCVAPDEVVRKRMEKKRSDHSEADYKVYLKVKKQFQDIKGEHLCIDTTKSPEELIKEILEFIGWSG